VGTFEEQTKGFQRLEVGIGKKGMGDSNEEAYFWSYATINRTSYINKESMN
jgi:hypothetical protein